MSDTILLQVNRGRGPEGEERDNSIMVRLERELDALADNFGIARLSAFRDYSAAEELEDDLAEQELSDGALHASWFDANAGYTTVRRLLDELRARPESLGFNPSPQSRNGSVTCWMN
jgi:hypothetical protein